MLRTGIQGLLALSIVLISGISLDAKHNSISTPTLATNSSTRQAAGSTLRSSRRKLTVVLYPIIPAFTDYMFQIKTGFEASAAGRDVQIEFQDLTNGYYDPTDANFIESAKADVYEIDSVFLNDFVTMNKIQELPSQLTPKSGEFLANGQRAAQLQNKWYGLPHWLCGNLLFFRKSDPAFAAVRTLADLQKAVGATHKPGTGLFIDLKGKSTLGEFYLMSLFDRYQSFSQVQAHLTPYDSSIEDDLKRVGSLCDTGFCRNGTYHNAVGFYESQFVHGRARAFVGYSESLYNMLWESQNACAVTEKCLTDADLNLTEIPLDDRGSKQMSWVDLLTVAKGCVGQCEQDAAAFIGYVNSEDTQVRALTGTPPRYLLPARASVYDNPKIQKAAPLYQQIRPLIESAETPTMSRLEQTLRGYGATLDQHLPAP